eukprot:8235323-Pyramimonas_sp.AAC.1
MGMLNRHAATWNRSARWQVMLTCNQHRDNKARKTHAKQSDPSNTPINAINNIYVNKTGMRKWHCQIQFPKQHYNDIDTN